MIRIENIHLEINNQVLLENETIEIDNGYLHVIMGESGSGKTTLLYEISLLSQLSNGIYLWNDKRIDVLNSKERSEMRRNNIGYVLQDLELISENLSLEENLRCMFALTGNEYDETKVLEYMQRLNLGTSLDQDIIQMSRGERQRFALVMALIKDVDLIICDEPTSALDIENSYELINCLKIIAREYNKMIVVATHDDIVADNADVLYRIENKHLKIKKEVDIINKISNKKVNSIVRKDFYKYYMNANKKLFNILMKVIYMLMILILCLSPIVLDTLLDMQKELYEKYASPQIIAVNTSERLPYSTYNPLCEDFDSMDISMIKEIEHVDNVEYYWELDGVIDDESIPVLIVCKSDIEIPVISSGLSKKVNDNIQLSLFLNYNYESYEFTMSIKEYEINDYPQRKGVDKEVIYVPIEIVKNLLDRNNIKASSSLLISCDDIVNIEDTINNIERWLPDATVTSESLQYINQIEMLENIQKYIIVLRIILIVGIIAITYIVQLMENKSRVKEINNLRINGMNKRMFYILYYYENKNLIILLPMCLIIGYLLLLFVMDIQFSFINIILLIVECIVVLIITRIIPLLISVSQIFIKDISSVLRNV